MLSDIKRPTAKLEFRDGRPVVIFNGKPVSQAMYSDPIIAIDPLPHSTPEQWLERCREMRDSGVHTYTIQPPNWVAHHWGETRFWSADGVYPDCSPDDPFWCVDKQAAAILKMDPDALFYVRFGDETPVKWFEANPDHKQQSWDGKHSYDQASMASEKALKDISKLINRVITYCEAQNWSDRVIGYLYYPSGEGIISLNCAGYMFDVCPAMQQAFKKWVSERYADETALREAWGDPEITFAAVRVPTDPEWRDAIKGVEHFIEGNQLRRFRDYWELQRVLFMNWYRSFIRAVARELESRPVIFAIDMAKQTMFGWPLSNFFGGGSEVSEFVNMFTGTGSIDIGELLDEPGLDMLVTPADYTARSVGYGWEPEGLSDSLHLRGKSILVENDCRTFAKGEEGCQGAFRDIPEVRAGFLRNSSWSLTRGHIDYWMIAGGEYFHHPDVQANGVAPTTRLLDAVPNWPHRETEHAVAMIIDDTSPWYENGTAGYQNLAVLWQRINGLAHCGIPYRVYLFSDLARENMPDYRCYLFPNLFKMDEERLAVLQRKVFRDGRMSIFGPATGITDGNTLSAEWASRVLGIEMTLVRKHAQHRVIVQGLHPIAQALPSSTIYGDSFCYGPILVPEKGAVEQAGGIHLGMATCFWGVNNAGLFLKDHGTHQVAWSAAVPIPANVLRELARAGGCHVWCEEDDVVYASETVAALHSVKSGPRTLKFPTARPVWDLLSGKKLGDSVSELTLDITAPETRLFYSGDTSPFA